MKLYGLNLAKAPVSGLPSYLEMVRNSATKNVQSVGGWLAITLRSNTVPIKSHGRLAGLVLKPLPNKSNSQPTGPLGSRKGDPIAKKWADNFTSKLDELSVKDPVFGQLRNVMDLCVVAAIIESIDFRIWLLAI